MITITTQEDLEKAIKNKEHEMMYNGNCNYIVYSKNDMQNAIEQNYQYVFPGSQSMKIAMYFITRHQEMESEEKEELAGPIIVALAALAVVLILGLTAILRNTETLLIRNADGSFSLSTKRPA